MNRKAFWILFGIIAAAGITFTIFVLNSDMPLWAKLMILK